MLNKNIDNKKINSLTGLFLIGVILIVAFFWGGGVSLVKQNIHNWPKTRAKVTSVKNRVVCETPERSSACYTLFSIEYFYSIDGKKYLNQMEQMYTTDFSQGRTFVVYYKKSDPQIVFPEGKIPTSLHLYLPLISGLAIVIFVAILCGQFRGPIPGNPEEIEGSR